METIFDHNPTEKEVKAILDYCEIKSKDEYLKNNKSQTASYFHIYMLYYDRNDMDKSSKYLELSGMPLDEIIDHCF